MQRIPATGALLALMVLSAQADPKPRPVAIDKGRILVPAKHGGYLPDAKLKGARLVGHDETGRALSYRIDSIVAYRDSLVALTLYAFSTPDSAGNWVPACQADRMGRRLG